MQQSSPGTSGSHGFVGAGAITAAIVAGLHVVDAADPPTAYLSPRGRRVGRDLASRFPNVRVCGSNQEVLEHATSIVVAVPAPGASPRCTRTTPSPGSCSGGWALEHAGSLATLTEQHMTPGGINQQFLTDLRRDGVPEPVRRALDRVLARLREQPAPDGLTGQGHPMPLARPPADGIPRRKSMSQNAGSGWRLVAGPRNWCRRTPARRRLATAPTARPDSPVGG